MPRTTRPKPHRGAATLTVAATLLLLTSLVALFTHQRLWFEQQASTNQIRATEAAELAQAGLEWATAQLNTSTLLAEAPSCAQAAEGQGTQSFRERYAGPLATSNERPRGLYPAADALAGCTLTSGGTLQCVCPLPGQKIEMEGGHFAVQFMPQPDDPLTIELWSTGRPDNTPARAQARQLVKLAPAIVHPPPAAILAGGHIHSTASLRVTHIDTAVPGVPLRAGGNVTTGIDTELVTGSGGGTASAVMQGDPALQQLSSADTAGVRFFEVITGRTLSDYVADPLTTVVDDRHCENPSACGALVLDLQRQGVQQFWLGADVTLALIDAAQLGGADKPVLIASLGTIALSGNVNVHGLLLAGQLRVDEATGGQPTVVGAVAVRGDVLALGAFAVTFDRRALGMAGGAPAGTLIPVPGSWRDRFAPY